VSLQIPIKHVVVLMFENRSFDHMLGLLNHHPDLPPVTEDALENPLDPADPDGAKCVPFALGGYEALHHDPKHGYEDVMKQLTAYEGPWQAPYPLTNRGFAWNYHARRDADGSEVLGCYTPQLLPAVSTLAREFAVCSRWFCSLPSETWPNRLFAHAGTSDNLVENDVRFYRNRTVFELLSKAKPKSSWQIYAGDIPQVSAFRELWWHDGGPRFSRLDEFFEHAREGRLKNYSFIEPRHFGSAMSDQHPLGKVLLGEHLIKGVYEALTENPETWNSTLLLITHDEHGGFFDREHPPSAVSPSAGAHDPKHGFRFDLLGPRVPTVVVSPYIERGTVDDEVHDHTSIIATLRELFGFDDTLTDRDAAATGVTHLLSRDDPRPPVQLPEVPAARAAGLGPDAWAEGVAPDGTIKLNDLQQQLVDLALKVEEEAGPPATGARGIEPAPAPRPPFRSEVEVGEFVEAFRRRQMEQM
jgi:phospholipase C